MNVIAQLEYIKVTKMIKDNHQYHQEEKYFMHLTSHYVLTNEDEFLLEEVLDMSYRNFSNNMGLLYLHTTKGLYSYMLKRNPASFINHYQRLK